MTIELLETDVRFMLFLIRKRQQDVNKVCTLNPANQPNRDLYRKLQMLKMTIANQL